MGWSTYAIICVFNNSTWINPSYDWNRKRTQVSADLYHLYYVVPFMRSNTLLKSVRKHLILSTASTLTAQALKAHTKLRCIRTTQILVLLRFIIIITVSHRHSVDCVVRICDMKDGARIGEKNQWRTHVQLKLNIVHVVQ